MTQEQCERAVKALQEEGFQASYVHRTLIHTNDHGVWLDSVWNDDLQRATSFRIHDEEIHFWESHAPIPDEGVAFQDYTPKNT